jgi:hypothetical protein
LQEGVFQGEPKRLTLDYFQEDQSLSDIQYSNCLASEVLNEEIDLICWLGKGLLARGARPNSKASDMWNHVMISWRKIFKGSTR